MEDLDDVFSNIAHSRYVLPQTIEDFGLKDMGSDVEITTRESEIGNDIMGRRRQIKYKIRYLETKRTLADLLQDSSFLKANKRDL
uniref:Uncharacterized protein n=1 Tax=Oryza rufipogon TaxID=4529 RepID=A0A0E0PN68_ORYRU